MVTRLLQTLGAEIRGLHAAAYLLSALTLAGQLVSLVRDRVFAELFGPGELLDFYYAAFRIPDFYYALIGGLVSAYVLLPLLAKASQEGDDAPSALIGKMVGLFLIAAAALAVPTAIFMEQLMRALYPEFAASANFSVLVLLGQVLLLQPIILGLSEIGTSVVQMRRKFVLYALAPVLYTLGIIFGAAVLVPTFGTLGLAYGVIIGALLHFAVQFPIIFLSGLSPRPRLPSPAFSSAVALQGLPRAASLAIQASVLSILVILAARLGTGSVTLLSFATGLCAAPLILIARAYAVAAFPALAELSSAGKTREFAALVADTARHVILWSALATGLIIVLRAHVTRVVYGTDTFSWDDTRLTAALVALLVLPVVAQALTLLLSRAYYAAGRAWVPLAVQAGGALLSAFLAYLFLNLHAVDGWRLFFETQLRIDGIADTRVAGLAFGFAVGQLISGLVGLVVFSRQFPGALAGLSRSIVQSTLAALVAGFAAYGTLVSFGGWFTLATLPAVLVQGLAAGIVGALAGIGLLALMRNDEMAEAASALKSFVLKRALPPPSDLS